MKPSTTDQKATISRRVLFAGAGVAGAAAAVSAVVPGLPSDPVAASEPQRAPPERGGGYVLSEHVKHYYRTARL
jgi:hypothetical protein